MIVYVSHPFGGKEENKLQIENIVKTLSIQNPHNTYISPISAFGFMYNSVPYLIGMRYCLDLLNMCDSMLVFGDYQESKGCMMEIEYAKKNMIPFRIEVEL